MHLSRSCFYTSGAGVALQDNLATGLKIYLHDLINKLLINSINVLIICKLTGTKKEMFFNDCEENAPQGNTGAGSPSGEIIPNVDSRKFAVIMIPHKRKPKKPDDATPLELCSPCELPQKVILIFH